MGWECVFIAVLGVWVCWRRLPCCFAALHVVLFCFPAWHSWYLRLIPQVRARVFTQSLFTQDSEPGHISEDVVYQNMRMWMGRRFEAALSQLVGADCRSGVEHFPSTYRALGQSQQGKTGRWKILHCGFIAHEFILIPILKNYLVIFWTLKFLISLQNNRLPYDISYTCHCPSLMTSPCYCPMASLCLFLCLFPQ